MLSVSGLVFALTLTDEMELLNPSTQTELQDDPGVHRRLTVAYLGSI